jgi:hypothetical protein
LETRIRVWFPQEPNAQGRVELQQRIRRNQLGQNSLGFKVRRWLVGFSAFMGSLWRQMSARTKGIILALSAIVLAGFVLYFLADRHLISNSMILWGTWIFQGGFLLYIIVDSLYHYFKDRTSGKNRLTVNINPILRLAGILVCGIATAVMVSTYLLELYVYSFPSNFPTLPFYLGILALLLYLVGLGLYMEWRKKNKLEPFAG